MSVSGFNLGMWALDIGLVSDGFAVKQSVLGRQKIPRRTATQDLRPAPHCIVKAAADMAQLNATIKQLREAVSLLHWYLPEPAGTSYQSSSASSMLSEL